VRQTVELVADEHPVHRRRSHAEACRDPVRANLVPPAVADDLPLDAGRRPVGTAAGPAGPVVEPLGAELEVSVPLLGRTAAGDAHRLGGVGDGSASLDAPAQQQSTCGVCGALRCPTETSGVVRWLRQPHTYSWRSLVSWITASRMSVGCGVVIDDIKLFNDKLQEWENFYNFHRP
jgi:hypothetical protein